MVLSIWAGTPLEVNTYDFYTGAAYGLETGAHAAELMIPYNNDTHLASSTYSNDTVAWNMASHPLTAGSMPMPAYQFNITFYSDASLVVARTNDTHTYTVSERDIGCNLGGRIRILV